MKLTSIRALFGAMTIGIAAFGVSTAQAVPVTFSTVTGSGFGGGLTTSISNGGVTVTFNGQPGQSVNTPAGAQFGDIVVTAANPTSPAAFNSPFTLQFNQTVPTVQSGTLSSTLSGNLGYDSGIATLTFTTTSLSLGGVQYAVNPSYTISLPSTGASGGAGTGTTTIQGTVNFVPDSGSTLALLGLALGALGLARRRFMS